jgi:alcohol dehydrogenase class IV
MMLPHVIRFNASNGQNPYRELDPDAVRLADRVEQLLVAGNLPQRLAECEISADLIPRLCSIAAKKWTDSFNPIPVGEPELRQILQCAL